MDQLEGLKFVRSPVIASSDYADFLFVLDTCKAACQRNFFVF